MPLRRILYASVFVAGGCLAAAFALAELWGWMALMAGAAVLFLWGLWRSSPWLPVIAGWGLLAGMVAAALGGLTFPLVLLAALGLLTAWDLARLMSRLALVKDAGLASEFAYRHLKSLGGVLLAALALGLLGGVLRLELSFIWIAGLVLMALILVRLAVSLAADSN